MGDVHGGAGAVTGTVLVDTNVFTARLRERSPLATLYAKHLFGKRIALAPQSVAEAQYGALKATWVLLARSNSHGSSGEHASSRSTSTPSRPSPSFVIGVG